MQISDSDKQEIKAADEVQDTATDEPAAKQDSSRFIMIMKHLMKKK